jgi:hypothetical protein
MGRSRLIGAALLTLGLLTGAAPAALANTINPGNVPAHSTTFKEECKGDEGLEPGQVLWHFIHTDTSKTDLPSSLSATFDGAGVQPASGYVNGNSIVMYNIITEGDDVLTTASDSIVNDGNLNLSHVCHGDDVQITGDPLGVDKDAAGSYKEKWTWDIDKSVDKTLVEIASGSATFNYTVSVSHGDGVISHVKVTGSITVSNPNGTAVTGVDVTDRLSDNTACDVTGGSDATIPANDSKSFDYTCDLGSSLPSGALDNTATASGPTIETTTFKLPAGSADRTIAVGSFTRHKVDECVSVSDTYAGTLGTVCVGDANPTDFTYKRDIPAGTAWKCTDYDNTATFTTNDTGATGSASQTVTVCHFNARLTPGYWKTHLTTGTPNTAQFLPQKLGDFSVSSTTIATAVWNSMNCGNADTNSQNALGCLAGHLLATELNLANHTNTCIQGAVDAANAFLKAGDFMAATGVQGYAGPTGTTYTLTSAQRAQAIALKNPLDAYNNGSQCH